MEEAKRESQKQFWGRVEAEERKAQAEAFYQELIDSSVSGRVARQRAVQVFQPLDGSRTVAWETPNRWEGDRYAPGRNGARKQKQLSYRKIVKWVWEHMSDANPPKAPNGKAQALLNFAQDKPAEFLDKYVPMLVRSCEELKEEEEAPKQDEEPDSYTKLLDEWIDDFNAKMKKMKPGDRCPLGTCLWEYLPAGSPLPAGLPQDFVMGDCPDAATARPCNGQAGPNAKASRPSITAGPLGTTNGYVCNARP